MGCDIHAHVEVKVNGKWQHYNHPNIRRDYELFSMMAGVRGYGIDVGFKQKGLPKNISFMTKYDRKQWGSDGHSDSWLSAREVSSICDWLEKREEGRNPQDYFVPERIFGYLFGNGWDFHKYPKDKRPFQDARLVFWFDN